MASAELIEQLKKSIRAIEADSPSISVESAQRYDRYASPSFDTPFDSRAVLDEHNDSDATLSTTKGKKSRSALDVIINLVNVSDHSEHSIRKRLVRDGFPDEEIENAVGKAKDYGFINDSRYAEVLIRSRISQGKGSAGIERELKSQNIDIETVEGWPYDYPVSYDEELNRAIDLLERKPPKSKNIREGAYRKLVSKGYSSSVASSASRIWVSSR